ncbi:hypothetical protein H2200_005084 [Cladophialophora chaetospira]|uniref:Uncharacterized protein n=1 Tax=Cladophialophora chaetospira TaxID=386627 RepID=A0AA39CJ93_9EURO|nr:hypothetical protein H2200_005084 [Cladophialophora chaetospira]
MASKRLLQEVRNTMISEAIRTRQPVHVDPAVWHDEGPMPVSPASDLDAIAIDLANLQALYEQYKNTWRIGFANGQTVLTAKDLSVIASFRRTATAIDQRLQIWADSQAPHFSPLRMAMIEVPESVRKAGMYGNFCNVYPSAQLAGIWHAYNSYRLILLKMTLSADQTVREMHRENDVFFAESDKWRETAEETLQHCVDEICAVVPFHLGNRTGTGSILEFSDTTNLEYPWPKPENDPYSSPSTPTARDYARRHNVVPLSSDERKRQNIAMGGYNILGPIAFVLGLAEEPLDLTGLRSTAPKLGSLLRPDQIPWLAGQLQRTLKLHRTRRLDGDARKVSTPVQRRSSEQESKDGNLMKKVAAVKKTMEYSFGV